MKPNIPQLPQNTIIDESYQKEVSERIYQSLNLGVGPSTEFKVTQSLKDEVEAISKISRLSLSEREICLAAWFLSIGTGEVKFHISDKYLDHYA